MSILDGKWQNKWGSVMDIVVRDGRIEGTYTTHTGSTHGTYPLIGMTQVTDVAEGAISFMVFWKNEESFENSVSTWTGLVEEGEDGEVTLATQLLYCQTMEPKEYWNSTLLIYDPFVRVDS